MPIAPDRSTSSRSATAESGFLARRRSTSSIASSVWTQHAGTIATRPPVPASVSRSPDGSLTHTAAICACCSRPQVDRFSKRHCPRAPASSPRDDERLKDERRVNGVANAAGTAIAFASMKKIALVLAIAFAAELHAAYHVVRHIKIGGTGGWDYLTVDSAARRLYVSHSDRVEVVDIDHQKVIGTIPKTEGVHGIAIAPDLHRGFVSNGRAGTMTIFDLDKLATIGEVKVTGDNPDAILYDRATKHVFTFNGRGQNATVMDGDGKVIATIPLGGKPEFAQSDLAGHVS